MIPVLLIGLGRIASLLEKDSLRNHPCTHAGSIFSPWGKKRFYLIGAIDPSEERRKQFCKDWNIQETKCFSDFQEWSKAFRSRKNLGSNSTLEKDGVPTFSASKEKTSSRSVPKVGTSSNAKTLPFQIGSKPKSRNSHAKEKSFDLGKCLVIIATPSNTHFGLASRAIRYGFRHLLVEKPVCHSFSHAKRLAKLCRETGTDLRVNHERRYHPLYRKVRKWIQEETFGPVRTIRASVLTSARNPGRAALDRTGPLFHDGTHAVDLLTWYLGIPDRIHSVLRSYPDSSVEEQAVALLTYPKGETVFLEAGGMRKYFQFELDIQTESARFLVGNDEVRFWKSKPSRKYKGFNSLTPVSISEKSSAGSNPFLNLYESLFRHLSGKPSEITGDMEENLRILSILETIRKKAEKRILEV
ncbi:Gfo/Idh/MocA family oxidoreductase [Leptospira sp. 201903071]|uniref:Gfo/Idh/MocA family protein n=1 Tax=Leptospira ainazelensis TaxID=2810034 RepID=UPI0019649E5F|nr:Gfo/Idh/MocA family oxidoreductase [Leptospira ainazelensis]MBM9502453.1 Gfo/Idh/MocA family oxidoreductase [Leptospira ainazelensis]